VLLALTFVVGAEIKGARRWINLPLVSLQPSEFVKPTFAVVAAWLFAEQKLRRGFPGNLISAALLLLILGMLILQPDIGMAVVVATVWFGQFYMTGLRLYWIVLFGLGGVGGLAAAYACLPHVRIRVDHFLDPAAGDSYQVNRSLEAFANGGLWGRGPGEGTIKRVLPEGHTDFVFAVAAEEFGAVLCLILLALFALIVIRTLTKAMRSDDPFIRFATAGLGILFGLQSAINMAVNLHLMPAKGMTLPFISYGGSSLISLAYSIGMLVALTRERPRAKLGSVNGLAASPA
jgi:cell division protein FtsW